MRNALLAGIGWLGLLQSWNGAGSGIETTARLIGMATALGTLTTLVFRLGIWRQEMENTKANVGAEVRAYRRESTANFDRIERRLDSIDRFIAACTPRA